MAATDHDETGDDEHESTGLSFWIGLAIGGSVMAYAVWGISRDQVGANPPGLVRYVLGAAILHDAIVAPVVAVIGLALAWILPARVRGPILGALFLSAVVALFAYPLVGAFGRHELNASTLPLDYGPNLALVIGLVWAAAAVVVATRLVRDRRSP
jgi:hypothetical protein